MIEKLMKENWCNELHIKHDKKSGCFFIAAMNTVYGDKGNGGTRMVYYPTLLDGIKDATKLVKVMTKKCVIIGKKYNGGYSGGKGVIVGNPKTQKTPEMLREFGKFVESLNGKLQTGTDMNIDIKDIEYMAEKSKFIDGLNSGLGDTAIPTAYGILVAMKTMCKWKYRTDSLKNKTIAVQGVGSVGADLVKRLVDERCRIVVTDIDPEKIKSIKERFNVETVEPDKIYEVKCDIFSPNACGGILTKETIGKLNCDMVIGAANNPLASEDLIDDFAKRKIVYVPDYVINIGGVFLSMCEVQGKDFDYVISKTREIIQSRLEQTIEMSKEENKTLYEAAEDLIKNELKINQQLLCAF